MKRMKAQPQHLIVSSSMHYYQEYSPPTHSPAARVAHAHARARTHGRAAGAGQRCNQRWKKGDGLPPRLRYLRYFDYAFAE